VILVALIGEAGGLEFAVLVDGAVADFLKLGCSCSLVSHEHRVSGPLFIGNVDAPWNRSNAPRSSILVMSLSRVPQHGHVTSVSWASAALAVFAYGCFVAVGDGRSGRTLALRVSAKLGTLSGTECMSS